MIENESISALVNTIMYVLESSWILFLLQARSGGPAELYTIAHVKDS